MLLLCLPLQVFLIPLHDRFMVPSRKQQNVDGVGSPGKGHSGKKKSWLKRIHLRKNKAVEESDGSGSESTTSTPQARPLGKLSFLQPWASLKQRCHTTSRPQADKIVAGSKRDTSCCAVGRCKHTDGKKQRCCFCLWPDACESACTSKTAQRACRALFGAVLASTHR